MQNTIFHPSLSPLSEAFPSLLACHHIGPLGPRNNIRVRYPISPPSPALFRDPFHKDLLKQEVPPLLNLGAVEMVPEGFKGKGFYSHYFLTPKRMEAYLRPPQIESVSLKMIQNGYPSFNNTCVKEERQFAALDLQDAYSHITIHPAHRRFLRFMVGTEHYKYQVLPFGLSSAPRVFSKMLAVVCEGRPQQAIIFCYLDNW